MNTARLVPATGTSRTDNGRVIMGGAPFTVIRVSDAGATMLDRWFKGHRPDWESPGQRVLAQKLIDGGLCLDVPDVSDANDSELRSNLTIIIPVRDDESGLLDTVDLLRSAGCPLIVVDDGSRSPIPASMLPANAILLRNEQSVGPGRARQQALPLVTTRLVVFIDAGVLVTSGQLAELTRFLTLNRVVAAAPRVRSLPGQPVSARYDTNRSPLDMGPNASLVGVGKLVPYVPTACLVVLHSSIVAVGGFDPELRYGEDVDLVWRLGSVGSVRYVPSVEVYHPARQSLVKFVRQRIGYGSAAAPLAKRYGDDVAPLRLTGTAAAFSLLAVSGKPWTAAVVHGLTIYRLARRLTGLSDATAHACILTLKGSWFGGKTLLAALCRSWWPFALVVALIIPSKRRKIGLAFSLGLARRLLDGPRRPKEAATDVAIGAVDDIAYGCGVWLGALRHRTIRPLLPAGISRRSTSGIRDIDGA